jgi:hypothetical protein
MVPVPEVECNRTSAELQRYEPFIRLIMGRLGAYSTGHGQGLY